MLSILFTNITLEGYTGTEVATLELAHAMEKRGHLVAVFSPTLGAMASRARRLHLTVTDRIEAIGFIPDIIHGHHNTTLALAMVRFPDAPAIFVCHDTQSPFDEPILDPRIGCYVAVDAACRYRLLSDGVDERKIIVIPNAVDLSAFAVRSAWRSTPRTALLIVKNWTGHIALVQEACLQAGVSLDIVGKGVENIVSDLGRRCGSADIVFAYSRSAVEAASTGAQVIIIDEFGYGGWFDLEQVLSWPETTLSNRVLSPMPTVDALTQTILGYDARAAQAVTHALRSRVDLSLIVKEWEEVYAGAAKSAARFEAPLTQRGNADHASLATFIARFTPRLNLSTEYTEAEDRARRHEQLFLNVASVLQELADASAQSIVFASGALGQILLLEGWHPAEAWGVWSAEERAHVWLPETILASWNYALEVDCHRYLPGQLQEKDVRSVTVSVGPHVLATWEFSPDQSRGPERKSLEIPAWLRPTPGRPLRLTFGVERPITPMEAVGSLDARLLGMGLVAFRAGRPNEPVSGRLL